MWKIATEDQAQVFNVNRRAILPAVYNSNLVRYDWNPPTPILNNDDFERQVFVNVKLEAEVTQLKGTIAHLQNKIGAENLTTSEMADLQDDLMDDGDFFEWLPKVPLPIGSIKTERESDFESSMENDDFHEAHDFGVSPNAALQRNESTASAAIVTSAIAPTTIIEPTACSSTSDQQQNLSDMDSVPSSSGMYNDKVAGSIEFTTDVSKVYVYSVFVLFLNL